MEIVFPVILLMFTGGTAVALVGYWWFHELLPAFILGAVPFLCAVSMVHWFIGKDRLDHVVGFMTVFSVNKYSDKAAQIEATYPCIQYYDFGRLMSNHIMLLIWQNILSCVNKNVVLLLMMK